MEAGGPFFVLINQLATGRDGRSVLAEADKVVRK